MKLEVADLCCCSGGASMGIYKAGESIHGLEINITGYDIVTQLRYPFNRRTMDIRDLSQAELLKYDFIWASPPCQGYSKAVRKVDRDKYPDILHETRMLLESTGKPFVIENVEAAPIRKDLFLCGEMFGLKVFKHRIFEIQGFSINQPVHLPHKGSVKYGDYISPAGRGSDGSGKITDWQNALDIHWERDLKKLAEAVPPAYSSYIFTEFIKNTPGLLQLDGFVNF